jgi:hypothetical protein
MRASVITLTLALSLLVAGGASASTTTKTLPASVVYLNGQNPTDPGNCSAIVFIQWPDVPHAVSWTVFYKRKGVETSEGASPPFGDVYKWVATYTVPPGSHWKAIGKSWRDGPQPNDCSEYIPKHQEIYGTEAHVVVEVDTTACDTAKAKQKSARTSVTKASKAIKKAVSDKAKRRARAKLKKAQATQKKAAATVKTECA